MFFFLSKFVHRVKAFFIFFTTFVGSFCAEPATVEVSTSLPVTQATENEQQKRSIVSDCDGPIVGGVLGGLHSDVAVHSDLGIGLHGHGYAPSYSGGYLASHGIVGGYGHLGAVGGYGHLGGVVASAPLVSAGYAPHAQVLASSVISTPVVSHAPVIAAPAVCNKTFSLFCILYNARN